MNRLVSTCAIVLSVTACAPKKPVGQVATSGQTWEGGYLARRGLDPRPTCVISYYGDWGKSCTDKADCEARCLLRYDGDMDAHPIGSPATGQCQREEPEIGCYAEIVQGAVATRFRCTD
jgi:hypothetical protein